MLVPPVLAVAPALHGWTWAWWALAAVCALATAVLVWPVRALRGLTALGVGLACLLLAMLAGWLLRRHARARLKVAG